MFILHLVFKGSVDDLSAHAQQLYLTADKYGVSGLRSLATDALMAQLDPTNAAELLLLAHLHGENVLEQK